MSTHPRRAEGVTSRELTDGELAILDSAGEQLLIVSPVGSAIWTLCDGQHDAREMAALVAEQFPTTAPEQILRDVERFLVDLSRHGCLLSP